MLNVLKSSFLISITVLLECCFAFVFVYAAMCLVNKKYILLLILIASLGGIVFLLATLIEIMFRRFFGSNFK